MRIFLPVTILAVIVSLIFFVNFKNKEIKKTLNSVISPSKKYSIDTPTDPVIVAAGDISCSTETPTDETCKQQETAKLIHMIKPDALLPLGDLQYPYASLDNLNTYFDKSWGAFKSIMRPVIGNHEYEVVGGNGYFDYFGLQGGERGKGYYSYDIGDWHLIALNSNCYAVGGCEKNSVQTQWLQNDLKKNKSLCTLAYWHHPLFSSGLHGNDKSMYFIWDILEKHDADVILSGHDHLYERFASQSAEGVLSVKGMRQFTVGTGGRNLYSYSQTAKNSEVKENNYFGVLKMILKNKGYEWEFMSTTYGFSDNGKDNCH